MFFSISIPVYNAEKYLDNSIGSVIKQTEKDFELILVNDGSKDNSLSICYEWQKKYPDKIRVIDKENSGSLLTRRVCLNASKGKFLYVMDADDYIIDKDFLKFIREKFEKTKCDLILFNATIDNNNSFIKLPFINNRIYEKNELNYFYYLLITSSYLNPLWEKVFSRNLVDWDIDYSKFDNITHCTDGFQSLPIVVNAKKILYINNIFYHYTVEENNNSIVHTFKESIYNSFKFKHKRLSFLAKSWNKIKNKDLLLKNSFMNDVKEYYFRTLLIQDKSKLFDLYKSVSNDSYFRENYNLKGNTLFTKLIVSLFYHKRFYFLELVYLVFKILNKIKILDLLIEWKNRLCRNLKIY